jgi:O-antigen/teichoic acid export membrane protein
MSTANRIVRNSGILYGKMVVTVFLSIYTTRLLLQALGITDFGVFNVVGGAIAMLTFLNTAMASATQRFMSFATGAGNQSKQHVIFNVSLILHFVVAIAVVIILEVVGHFLFKNVFKIPYVRIASAQYVYQFMVISTALTIMSVPYDAVINAHENMLLFAILGVIESILKMCIAFYITYTNSDKLLIYGLLMAVLSILLLVLRRVYCRATYSECTVNLRQHFSMTVFRDLTHFAAWSFLGASSSMLTGYGQGLVMNAFFGPIVNTSQGIANQVSGQLGAFAGTMLKALNPIIDKSEGAGNRGLMLKAAMMGSKLSFLLLIIFFIPVLVDTHHIFKMWLVTIPEYAVVFCQLLLVRNLIDQLFVTLTGTIAAVGNIKRFQIYTSILNISPLIVGYFAFTKGVGPQFLYGFFIIVSVINCAFIIYFTAVTCQLNVKEYMVNVVFRCVLSFAIIFSFCSLLLLLEVDEILRLALIVGTTFLLYCPVVWYIGFDQNERNIVAKIVRGLTKKITSNLPTCTTSFKKNY